MRIYDELFKIHQAINNEMPMFDEGRNGSMDNYEIPNQTRLPKDFMVAGHNQNEKFLNDWQSTIEDHTDDDLKTKFIDYQNDQFTPNSELSSNHKEGFFKCVPRKLFSPTQPLVTFSNATLNRGPYVCTEYGGTRAMTDNGWTNKSGNTAYLAAFKTSGDFGLGNLCYTHIAAAIHDEASPNSSAEMAFYDTALNMEGTAVSAYGIAVSDSYAWVNVSAGSRDLSGIRAAFFIGSATVAVRSQTGLGSQLAYMKKNTSYSSLQSYFGTTNDGSPAVMKIKGEEP